MARPEALQHAKAGARGGKRPGKLTGKARPRKTQAERSRETQTRILEASVELMRQRGYAHFRTAEVAQLAGVSRGAQLHHFPTKESLVQATLQHVFDKSLARTQRLVSRPAPDGDVLERIIEDAREFFFQGEFFITLDIVMSVPDTGLRNKVLAMAKASRLPAEEAWLQVLIRSGIPPQVADDILWLTLSIVRGFAVRMLWQDEPDRFDRLFAIWQEIARDYIAARLPKQARRA